MSAKLTCISTGSIGNAYILECNGEKLLIELGVKWKDIMKGVGYDLSNIAFCLITHQHGDHSKSIPEALKYGLKVYSTPDVSALYPKVKALEPMKRYKIGGWEILPLKVEHNVECFGYVIDNPNMGRLVFYTDTKSFRYTIQNVNFILGEVNFCDDTIIDNLLNGESIRSQYDNHMSLDAAIGVVKRLYNPNLSRVMCCHLSDTNSSEETIATRFYEELGIRVDFCDKDKIFELNKYEF